MTAMTVFQTEMSLSDVLKAPLPLAGEGLG